MKLLFDENLSPHLPELLSKLYPDSVHVQHCGLGSADDEAVWNYALENGYVIVSKDSDFQERSVLRGAPPKIIWLRMTNCTSAEIEKLLNSAHSTIVRFIRSSDESCLSLGLGR